MCCTFKAAPIHFRTTTARYCTGLDDVRRAAFLKEIALDNGAALAAAIEWCIAHRVGAFRINSGLLPLYTHPELGYRLEQIDPSGEAERKLRAAGELAQRGDIRLSFHPDPFVRPGSPRRGVVERSLEELEYQSFVADLVSAEQVTLHAGSAADGKQVGLDRLRRGLDRLSESARSRVVLENDDRAFSVEDLLPLCRSAGFPLAYDVHHHRCHPDRLSIEEATDAAAETWGEREPWAHLSSPLGGWEAAEPRRHADYLQPSDFPRCWIGRRLTIDIEAKAKELAVLRLSSWLAHSP